MFDFTSPLTYIGFFFLLAFVLISLQHIYYCYKENEPKRKLTKTLCVPALAIAAVFLAPMRWQIYVGAAVGAIGDYFLLKKHFVKFLALGMLFFLIHLYLPDHLSYLRCLLILPNPEYTKTSSLFFSKGVHTFPLRHSLQSIFVFLGGLPPPGGKNVTRGCRLFV